MPAMALANLRPLQTANYPAHSSIVANFVSHEGTSIWHGCMCVCVCICEGKTAETIFLATFYVVLLACRRGQTSRFSILY